jgi:putative ABC transport system permease protein
MDQHEKRGHTGKSPRRYASLVKQQPLLAQLVTQRAPEIAVRVALGASRTAVIGMLLRQSALLIFAGTAAGIATSVAFARLLASMAGEVNPLDGITLIGVAALLTVVGAAATLVPLTERYASTP